MRQRKYVMLFVWLVFVVSLLSACCPLCFRPNHQWVPDGGVWYCEELQAQLAFDKESETYMMINGEKVVCSWINEIGSTYFYICCEEKNHPYYKLGATIFSGKVTHLDDENEYIITGENDVEYVFVRID